MASMHTLLIVPCVACAFLTPPPATEPRPVTETMHGETFVDEYRWLESLEKDSAEVQAWTTQQNDHTRQVLDTLPCRAALERSLTPLMQIGGISLPGMRGHLYFYSERTGSQNQPVLKVRDSFDGTPRTLLDVNAIDDKGLTSLDWYSPSPDGQFVAFGLSRAGDEMSELHVLSSTGGTWLADTIPGKVDFGGWMPDGRQFTYSRLSDPKDAYSRTVKWHLLGMHERSDPTLFAQQAPSRVPGAGLSRDGRWLTLSVSDGWQRNDLSIASVDEWKRTGRMRFQPVAVDLEGRFEPFAIEGNTMYIQTTWQSPNGRVLVVDLSDPAPASWRTIIPERKEHVLDGASTTASWIVVSWKKDVTTRVELFRRSGVSAGELTLPGLGSAGISTDEDRDEAFVSYESFNEPRSIYHTELTGPNAPLALWARPDVPVDPTSVEVSQHFVASKDGTKIPVFIVHRKGLKLDGSNPCLLYGYGGFNVSMEPGFNATNWPWFEAGGVYALANLRGGGEYGESWHSAGMLGKKQNVFDDLYAVAQWLSDKGYTKPERLAVQGGSNGGLLTGVAITQRPDLWSCVVCQVPLLDMLRYQQFLMAKFWVPEYGCSDDATQFPWLRAYSPYHHVKQGQRYPAMLITAGENDSRVHPLHARKMAARMQALAANDHEQDPILLWVDRDGGHGQGKPLALRVRDAVDRWSFIMWQTGCCR